MTLMNVLVDFARTGHIGPLRCGMPLTEAEDLLGPGRPHPAIRKRNLDQAPARLDDHVAAAGLA
ncbi:hypothetical protein [Streptomyces sp. NBC_00271]|uniref:hypothetical protein n=1 Tax=Streptomyces sp. NBC_00271 TaxID=2975697 RepID=UPI002E2B51E5|nr:hypothetical protein [Streptomyces sp. NBC_00271]